MTDKMTKKDRFSGIIGWFSENMPVAGTELHYETPFQLLVAVILSAQCTDRRVNMTTPEIFRHFPDPQTLAAASFEELFPYVQSISYPNSKTRHLIAMAQKLIDDFGGEVPSGIDELMSLPGVRPRGRDSGGQEGCGPPLADTAGTLHLHGQESQMR